MLEDAIDLLERCPSFVPTTRRESNDSTYAADANSQRGDTVDHSADGAARLHDLRGDERDPAARGGSRHLWPARSLIWVLSTARWCPSRRGPGGQRCGRSGDDTRAPILTIRADGDDLRAAPELLEVRAFTGRKEHGRATQRRGDPPSRPHQDVRRRADEDRQPPRRPPRRCHARHRRKAAGGPRGSVAVQFSIDRGPPPPTRIGWWGPVPARWRASTASGACTTCALVRHGGDQRRPRRSPHNRCQPEPRQSRWSVKVPTNWVPKKYNCRYEACSSVLAADRGGGPALGPASRRRAPGAPVDT